MIDSATSDAGPTSFAPEEGRVERARSSEAPHPLGLAPAPQGKLDVPPGAYMHVGPPLPANALGTAEWLPDDAADNCMRCGEEFSFFTRKHHCRQCGQIFCGKCCASKALLQANSGTAPEARVSAHPFFGPQETDPRKPQRVCQKCFDLLLPMQARHDGAILCAQFCAQFSDGPPPSLRGSPSSRRRSRRRSSSPTSPRRRSPSGR
jgi:hypothetical protein